MLDLHAQFVTNAAGQPIGVFLDLATYQQILAALEELDDIEAFDAALQDTEEAEPLAAALAEIDRRRQSE
jgi:hypothetical protein